MSQENIDIVREAYRVAFVERNVDGVLDRLHDEFEWKQRTDWPGRSVYKAAEIPLLWAELDETYPDMKLVPVEFEDAGDYVIVTVETSARLRGSERRIEGRIWHVWRMRNGIALEGGSYGSRQEAAEAAGLPG
jgi:ketosteroid isomerase-like protein